MGNRGCIHRPDQTLGVTPLAHQDVDLLRARLERQEARGDAATDAVDGVVLPRRGDRAVRRAPPLRLLPARRPPLVRRVLAGGQGPGRAPAYAWEMDIALHAERVDRRRTKLTRPAVFGDLPDGAMVSHLTAASRPWSPAARCCPGRSSGYRQPARRSARTEQVDAADSALDRGRADGRLPALRASHSGPDLHAPLPRLTRMPAHPQAPVARPPRTQVSLRARISHFSLSRLAWLISLALADFTYIG